MREAPPVALLDANALWSADEFLTRLWLTNTAEVLIVLREQAGHRINPPRTVFDIRTTLERSIPHFVGAVRESGLVGRRHLMLPSADAGILHCNREGVMLKPLHAAYGVLGLFLVAERLLRRGAEARSFVERPTDRGTTRAIGIAFGVGGLALEVAPILNRRGIARLYGTGPAWVGVLIMAGGLALRIWAARVGAEAVWVRGGAGP